MDELKRHTAHWPLYAAVTGSAMAMATNLAAEQPSPASQSTRQSGPLFERVAPVVTQASVLNAPSIGAGGVVPLYGSANVIQPGEWVSIFGTHLAGGTAYWNGDFPTSLGGTSVEINGKAAYLSFVSPGQINLQAPDDTATGKVSVVVTTSVGKATSTVTLSPFSPAFELRDIKHVAGIIVRPDGSGIYGNGAYDILGPDGNCFGYQTVSARPGDVVAIFGVGFGPTTPAVPAGQVFSGAAPVNSALSLFINSVLIEPTFVGLSSAGLYQINLVVPPGLGEGDVRIVASAGGILTQPGLVFSLQGVTSVGGCIYVGDGGDGDGDGGDGGDGGGDGGDGGDGA